MKDWKDIFGTLDYRVIFSRKMKLFLFQEQVYLFQKEFYSRKHYWEHFFLVRS